MDELQNFLNIAIEAAKISKQIHQYYEKHGFSVESKSTEADIVTTADKEAEEAIRAHISKAFPSHGFLGEEGGETQKASPHRWIIDPIDGTSNFTHGFPFYCTSIALEIEGVIQIGVVLDSTRDELFWAVRGQGAHMNKSRIFVSAQENMKRSLFATGFTTKVSEIKVNRTLLDKALERGLAIRRAGSAALDLCYVAAGRTEAFWELYLRPWDIAAGKLIVEEAGGLITTVENKEHSLKSKSILASNPKIHKKLLKILAS